MRATLLTTSLLLPLLAWSSLSHAEAPATAPAGIEAMRRLFDFTPVSAANPVLVSVKEYNIEIPVSEFKAYVDHEVPPQGSEGKPVSLEEKHKLLNALLDDHLLVWEGYQLKADQTPEVRQMLNISRTDAMKAALMDQEVQSKARTQEGYEKLATTFRQKLFDAAEVHVARDAYEKVKAAAKKLNAADAAQETPTTVPATFPAPPTIAQAQPSDGLTEADRNARLATSKVGAILVGDFLNKYREMPVDERPNLEKQDAFEGELQAILEDSLLVAEAAARHLDKSPAVLQQVQMDRNALARQGALEQVTQKTAAAMKEPGTEEKLKQWYQSHLATLYTNQTEDGKPHVIDYNKEHEMIQNDYFDDLQDKMQEQERQHLREGKTITIDEKILGSLPITWTIPSPTEPAK